MNVSRSSKGTLIQLDRFPNTAICATSVKMLNKNTCLPFKISVYCQNFPVDVAVADRDVKKNVSSFALKAKRENCQLSIIVADFTDFSFQKYIAHIKY